MKKRKYFNIQKSDGGGQIDIFDEIGGYGVWADMFNQELNDLGDIDHLDIFINSPGGDIIEGNAIYTMIQNHSAYVHFHIMGIAASMGSVLPMAGDRVSMASNAFFMIHNPWGGVMGEAKEMHKQADLLEKMKAGLVTAYANKTGLSHEVISDLMDEETWFTADEALAMGFIDDISGQVQIAAKFDNKIKEYTNAPAAALEIFTNNKGEIMENINQEEAPELEEVESVEEVQEVEEIEGQELQDAIVESVLEEEVEEIVEELEELMDKEVLDVADVEEINAIVDTLITKDEEYDAGFFAGQNAKALPELVALKLELETVNAQNIKVIEDMQAAHVSEIAELAHELEQAEKAKDESISQVKALSKGLDFVPQEKTSEADIKAHYKSLSGKEATSYFNENKKTILSK